MFTINLEEGREAPSKASIYTFLFLTILFSLCGFSGKMAYAFLAYKK